MTDAAPARKPRRLRRWAVRLGLVAVLLAALVWLAPTLVAKSSLRQVALDRALADLKGRAVVGDADLGWFSPVELRDVRVTDAAGGPVLTAARVTSSKTLLQLARDQSDLGTFTVENPTAEVVCEAGKTNVEDLIANYLADDTPSKPERTGVVVAVTGGRVVLKESGRDGERVIEPVAVTVTVPKSRTEPVALTVTASSTAAGRPGSLDLEATFDTVTTGKLRAEGFALGELGPALRRFATGTELAGTLTADLTGRWSDDAGKRTAAVDGRVEVADLDLAGPWLGPDRVRLRRAMLPCKAALDGDELRVERAVLTCDAGTVDVGGIVRLDEPADRLLARPGLRADADVDLARLAAVVPRLLRVKEGTELREGRVAVHLASVARGGETAWEVSVRTTALKGTRDGRPLAWEQPLRADFAARLRPDGRPVFDKLECLSDFVGLAARGSPEEFVARADVDLDRLAARLGEFVDLGGVKLGGRADVLVQTGPRPGGGVTANATVKLTRFAFADGSGHAIREPDLTVAVRASGAIDPNGPVRIDTGDVKLTAAGDDFTAALQAPVADARSFSTGKLAAKLSGDLGRWRNRVGAVAGVPADWVFAGTGTATGTVALTAEGVGVEGASAYLTNARFRGAGVELDERFLKAETGLTWDRKTGTVALTNVVLHCDTAVFTTPRLDLKPTPGGYAVATDGKLTANVNRVQRALKLQSDPADSDAMNGLAIGTVGLRTAGSAVRFNADLKVDGVLFGPPAKPIWSEPWVKLTAAGELDPTADVLRFTSLKAERDGLTADAKGTLAKLGTTQELDVGGTLAYDLARLEPQLKAYLGKGSQAVGKDAKPFHLTGRLSGGALAVKVGNPASPLATLDGNAALGWQALKAYGFEVGPAELKATLARGVVTATPVEATFGGGKVRLEPRLDLLSKGYDLTFAKGRVIDRAKLTPAACANAVGYALPAIANVAQADGLVSLDLDDNTVPLADPDKATVRGRLTLHNVTVSPGPVVAQVYEALGTKSPTLHLANEQVVAVRLENGRVYHENLTLTVGQSAVKSSGSVGLDGSLALVLDLPVPPKFLDAALKNNSLIRDALAKQRIKVPLGGTLAKPVLDARGLEAGVQQAIRDAGKSAGGEFLKQNQDKLLQELQKKLGPKK